MSPWTVGDLLRPAGYSLNSNRKTTAGVFHPDRNAQFEFINQQVQQFQHLGQQVILVDPKKSSSACLTTWNQIEHRMLCHIPQIGAAGP